MTTSVTGKLTKPANIFQAGDSTGFGLRIGVQYYDRETKQKEWTNYEAVIFAKAQSQIDFYKSSLVEGSIVELSGESEKIKQFQGNDKLIISIELNNAKVGYIFTGQSSAQQAAPQQQGGYNQQAPQQNQGGYQQPQQPQQGGFNNQAQQPPRDQNGFTQAQGVFQNQQ
jgi:single-strand DNA-binding protein